MQSSGTWRSEWFWDRSTRSFVQVDYHNTGLSIKPLRDLDALLEESRQVLSGTAP